MKAQVGRLYEKVVVEVSSKYRIQLARWTKIGVGAKIG